MGRRRAELELFYWTIRLGILFLLPLHVSDVGIYLTDLDRFFLRGEWPYRDFAFEYPPLAFLFLLLPGWLMKALRLAHEWDYRLLLGLLLLPFDYALFRGFVKKPPIARAAFLYVCFTALLPQLLFDRLDLLVGFGIAYPFFAAAPARAGDARFAAGWGFASALKLIPLLLLPFRLLESRPPVRRWLATAILTALPLALSTDAVLLLSRGPISFLSHHSQRGVQVESLLGNLFLSLHALGFGENFRVETAFRSQQLGGVPGLIEGAKFLFWSMLGITYGTLVFAVRKRGFTALRAAWLFLLTFVTFGYVLSPQFFFWLIPLAIFVAAELKPRARAHFLLGFFLILLMTGVHFADYWNYAAEQRLNVLFLFARNALLLGFWVMSWVWFRARPLNGRPDPAAR
jgi:hypothetical protein